MAVDDLELVAVERAHRRAGGAVALGVVLSRRGTGSRSRPPAHGGIRVTSPLCVLIASPPCREDGPPGCTGQPRCAQRFEMIVKLGAPFSRPLLRTYAVRRETVALRRIRVRSRDHELALGEVVDRAEVDVLRGSASRTPAATRSRAPGTVTIPPITAPRPERRALEEDCCAGSARLGAVGRRRRARRRSDGALGGGASARSVARGDVARPEERRRPSAIARRPPATQLTTRPTSRQTTPTAKPTGHRLGADVRSLVPVAFFGFHRRASPTSLASQRRIQRRTAARQRRNSWRNAPSSAAPDRSEAVLVPALVDEPRTSSLISISGGHWRVALGRALVRRVDPELAAVELQRTARGRDGRAGPR